MTDHDLEVNRRPAFLVIDASVVCHPFVDAEALEEIARAVEFARRSDDVKVYRAEPEPESAAMDRARAWLGGERVIVADDSLLSLLRRVLYLVDSAQGDASPRVVWVLTDRIAPSRIMRKSEKEVSDKIDLLLRARRADVSLRILPVPVDRPATGDDLVEAFSRTPRASR